MSLYPLSDQKPYISRNLLYCAYAFRELGIHSEFFSMSDRTAESSAFGFRQHEIKSFRPLGSKFSIARYLDFLCLILFGFRPSVELINHSPRLVQELTSYNPDLVILADNIIAKLVGKYASEYKRKSTKIICLSDSYKGIQAEIDSGVYWVKEGTLNDIISGAVKRILKKRYTKYHMYLYNLEVKFSDAFLTTDDVHKREIQNKFPKFKKKIFALYPEYRQPPKIKGCGARREIKNILFIGSYTHTPNAIAIKAIRERIAPKLPDKTFIIFGDGCPNKKSGNVTMINGHGIPTSKVLKAADVCISPMTEYNSGIKTKVIEYICANKIVIGTSESLIGYNTINNVNVIVEDKIDNYPARIRELDKNLVLRRRIQKNARTMLGGFAENNVRIKWLKVLHYIRLYN